jgi:hypothetical protein
MGRPKLRFDAKDRRFVDALIRHGVTATAVAAELGIDEKTLNVHFREVIETARADAAAPSTKSFS